MQVNQSEQRQLANSLVNDMLGLGPLQVLVDDTRVADIMVNGPNCVFVEIAGKLTDQKFAFVIACILPIYVSALPHLLGVV